MKSKVTAPGKFNMKTRQSSNSVFPTQKYCFHVFQRNLKLDSIFNNLTLIYFKSGGFLKANRFTFSDEMISWSILCLSISRFILRVRRLVPTRSLVLSCWYLLLFNLSWLCSDPTLERRSMLTDYPSYTDNQKFSSLYPRS